MILATMADTFRNLGGGGGGGAGKIKYLVSAILVAHPLIAARKFVAHH
jgi:hypothetical protein